MKKIYSILLLIALLSLFGCANVQDTPDTQGLQNTQDTQDTPTDQELQAIKVGFMGPLTGDAASYGESIKKGVELALQDHDANIELIVEDSKCDGKEAVTVLNKLASLDKVQAIVGEVCSGATIPSVPIAQQNTIVLISPASTSPDLSGSSEYFFRTVPSDALQGAFGAELVESAGHERLAIIYSNEDYGVGFKTVLAEAFEALGGLVVIEEAFERTTVDLRTPLTKIMNANPDAIYIVSNSPDSAVAILKQIKELGIEAVLYGSEGLKGQYILDNARDAAEGLIVSSVSSGTSDFIEKHEQTYSESPGPFAAQGYDALSAIARAIDAGAKTGEDIREYIAILEFDGASGHIAFDENGDISGNYDTYIVQNDTFVQQ